MTGLETTYYIVGIVFMVAALMVLLGIVTALFVIRNKVVTLEKTVQEKVHGVTQNVEKVVEIANAVREVARAVKK
jgi:hypothetical protein